MRLLMIRRLFIMSLSLSLLAIGIPILRAQAPDSEKITKLFNEMKTHAVLAEEDADLLESYTRSTATWGSHARRLSDITVHVRDLLKDYNEAQAIRGEGSDWQKEAIDEIMPLVKGMADHLSASIDHLNKNQAHTSLKPWHDYVHGNREYIFKTADLIRAYVDYGEAKAKADVLEKKLELPPSPGQE